MKNRIAFALLMGSITTGFITFVLVYLNLGFGSLFLKVWMRSWGLAYVLVIPIILAVAPRLRGLIARLFVPMKGAGADGTGELPQRITFALAMGAITTGVISFAVIFMNLGVRDDFTHLWIKSWALGYVAVIPMLLIVAPGVQRLVNKVVPSSP